METLSNSLPDPPWSGYKVTESQKQARIVEKMIPFCKGGREPTIQKSATLI